jgi:enamine deaminase RidA (YjgF/YER057c/UK114 family)
MDWTPLNPATVVPPPGGWFSHAAKVELTGASLMFVSGQVALDDEGNLVGEGDMSTQTEQVFATLQRILADQGATFDDVVNIRTFVTDMSRISDYGAVRARYLTGSPPTSTTVQVTRLVNPGALVEIDIVAVIGNHAESDGAPIETRS